MDDHDDFWLAVPDTGRVAKRDRTGVMGRIGLSLMLVSAVTSIGLILCALHMAHMIVSHYAINA